MGGTVLVYAICSGFSVFELCCFESVVRDDVFRTLWLCTSPPFLSPSTPQSNVQAPPCVYVPPGI